MVTNIHLPQDLNPIVSALSIICVPAKHCGNRTSIFVKEKKSLKMVKSLTTFDLFLTYLEI